MKYLPALFLCVIILAFFAGTASAVPCIPGQQVNELCNPVERPGGSDGQRTPVATNIVQLAAKIMFIVSGFATLLPIIAVTYAGFSMVISQGNQEAVTRAKTALTWAVVGFTIAILSYVIVLSTIHLIGATRLESNDPLAPADQAIQNPLGTDQFVQFVQGMLQRFLQIVGVIAILYLIVSGFRYVTSGGNEEQSKQGKEGLKWAILGIITILLSYVIIKATAAIFGIS